MHIWPKIPESSKNAASFGLIILHILRHRRSKDFLECTNSVALEPEKLLGFCWRVVRCAAGVTDGGGGG